MIDQKVLKPTAGFPQPVTYEGSRAVISEIEINGTTKTGDGWVRHYLAFKEGDVLTPEKIRQTQRDLYATNAFREVSIRTEPTAGDGSSMW